MKRQHQNTKTILFFITALLACSLPSICVAQSLGDIANNLLGPTRGITQLMYGVSYVAGAGMLIMALMQYKAHRDNPSQVRLGTPIAFFIFGLIFVLIPLISKHSSSSGYVVAHERQQQAEDQAPLEYGKHRPATRPQPQLAPRSQASPDAPAPIDPNDSDWY